MLPEDVSGPIMNYSGAVLCHIGPNLSATVKYQPVAAAIVTVA